MATESISNKQLSLPRWLFLGIASIMLCQSYLMTIFTPFPLIMASLLYGRARGLALSLLGTALTGVLSYFFFKTTLPVIFYVAMSLIGFMISESILRGLNSVKTIVWTGLSLFTAQLLLVGLFLKQNNLTLKSYLVSEITLVRDQFKDIVKTEQTSEVIQMINQLSDTEKLAQTFMEVLPGYFLAAIFFVLWVNMYLSLRSRRLLAAELPLVKTEKELLDFRMPFYWVYFVVLGLALHLWGSDLGGPYYKPIGENILRVLGVFYFFVGLSIITKLFDTFGIYGLFRSILMFLMIFFGSIFIAALGLFDCWFDFSEKIKKIKFNKGE